MAFKKSSKLAFYCTASLVLLVPLVILGCGGGGGGGNSSSPTPTPSPTAVATATSVPTATTTATATASSTPTKTPTPTATKTPTPTATKTPTPTATPTATPVPTTMPIGLRDGHKQGGVNAEPVDYTQPNNVPFILPTPTTSDNSIDGDTCDPGHYDYHIHSHLSIFYKGQQYVVPAGIGIKTPVYVRDNPNDPAQPYTSGFAGYGECIYPLHTHDTSGKLHVEAATKRTFTLGEVFDIWGQPLTKTNVAGLTGAKIEFFTNDGKGPQLYTGDPKAITLASKREITVRIDSSNAIPTYIFYGENSNLTAHGAAHHHGDDEHDEHHERHFKALSKAELAALRKK